MSSHRNDRETLTLTELLKLSEFPQVKKKLNAVISIFEQHYAIIYLYMIAVVIGIRMYLE